MCKLKSPTDFNSLVEMIFYFKEERTCLQYIEQRVWNGSIKCLVCQSDKIYRFKDGITLKCSACKKQFNAKSGTIFEGTKLPLVKWFTAMYLISSHKKGISSHQLARDLNITQCRAWPMLQKIRKIMKQDEVIMEGVVEVDETFIGGRNKNRHKKKKVQNAGGRSFKDKVAVLGLYERGHKIKTVVITDTKGETIKPIVFETILPDSTLISDEWHAYHGMGKYYRHEVVDHGRGQYVNANGATTNSVEGFWTHLKKSLTGIYHRVSKQHLQKYLDEMCFRWNTRGMKEVDRLALLMSKVNYKHNDLKPSK